jgi:2-amino-4-hydroxy-6-hydroxymethyldihydropteridine diphosphokinase
LARAHIGVGANVGDAVTTVRGAIDALGRLGTVVRKSSLYRSKPWGVREQPDFINAVALLDTDLNPHALLAALKELEREFGRVPGSRWGPRALDLDILTYDDEKLDEAELVIPHPFMRERSFVLVPLAEIDDAYSEALAALPAEARADVEPL